MLNKLTLIAVVALLVIFGRVGATREDFVQTKGNHFVLDERPLYFNGFNAYWLMYQAADPSTRPMVTTTLKQASEHGVNLIRTWAFNDGAYRALQITPGVYDEIVFQVHVFL